MGIYKDHVGIPQNTQQLKTLLEAPIEKLCRDYIYPYSSPVYNPSLRSSNRSSCGDDRGVG